MTNSTTNKTSQIKDDFYSLTTPIYYVNAAPHLGTAYTTIAADVAARYQRMTGKDVGLITGMDEHGQKVADTAKSKNLEPQEWCDSMEPVFREEWNTLDISYTSFVRTTSEAHKRGVQKFWADLYDKGYLYKSSYDGWYCVHEETHYQESELIKTDEGEFLCPECKRPVQKSSGEENWFFKLSSFQEKLLDYYNKHPEFIRPETRRNEIISFVKSGLKDLSISRSTFNWGVPFTFDKSHVAYVWADALISYLTGFGYGDPKREDEFNHYWPVEYHIVGKDITRFHCVIWPAMLMAAGLELPKCIFGHGFILTKGEKMSKSRGNAVKPDDIVKVFGLDAYRYYFLSDVTFGADGSVSLERMVQVYNSDLANTWGNLVSRVFNMTKKYFDNKIPNIDIKLDNPLKDLAGQLFEEYNKCMCDLDFSGCTKAVVKLAEAANIYVQDTEPWSLAKQNKIDELSFVLYNLLEAIRIIAMYMYPFMPITSSSIFKSFGLEDVSNVKNIKQNTEWGQLNCGSVIEQPKNLFPRLDINKISFDL